MALCPSDLQNTRTQSTLIQDLVSKGRGDFLYFILTGAEKNIVNSV